MPSTEEYWHIGDTAIRLRSLTLRICSGENSPSLIALFYLTPIKAAELVLYGEGMCSVPIHAIALRATGEFVLCEIDIRRNTLKNAFLVDGEEFAIAFRTTREYVGCI